MGPEDRVLELLPLIQASGSGTLGRAGELLHYRNEQKHRIHQNRPGTSHTTLYAIQVHTETLNFNLRPRPCPERNC